MYVALCLKFGVVGEFHWAAILVNDNEAGFVAMLSTQANIYRAFGECRLNGLESA